MDGTIVGRRQLIARVGVAGAGAVGALALLRPQTVLAAEDEERGIVGGWRGAVNDLDSGSTIQVAIAFAPGGAMMETDDGGTEQPGTGVGAWVAVGEHRYRIEFFSFAKDPKAGNLTITVKGPVEYHPASDTLTGTSTIEVVTTNGTVLFKSVKGQTVRATRIHP